MASLPNPKTVSYEEWLLMPEVEDATEEVVDGEIIIMPPAKIRHARIVTKLCRAFGAQLDPNLYWVVDTDFGLIIRKSPLTSREPDLAVFELSTLVEQHGYIHSAPQFLAEVLSPASTRREMDPKLADYASIGVPEVWVVSPEARTVEVLYLEEAVLRRDRIAAQGTLTPRYFPTVPIDIATIWPD